MTNRARSGIRAAAVLAVLVAAARAAAAPPPAVFTNPRTIGAGSPVAVADLNGDGAPDLVLAGGFYGEPSTVSVRLGRGDGTFGNAHQVPGGKRLLGLGDRPVAVGDLNGDGIPDLALADHGGAVGVLLGKGDGSFGAMREYPVRRRPNAVAIGDVNGDRVPDLVVADGSGIAYVGGDVTILPGEGDGTFGPALYHGGVGPGARSVAAADVNGDGIADVVVATKTGVAVLLGTRGGPPRPVRGPDGPGRASSLALADLNGDGVLDLAVAHDTNDQTVSPSEVRVWLGNGDGSFRLADDRAVCCSVYTLAPGDLNGDGIPDLALASSKGVDVLLGRSDGRFGDPLPVTQAADLLAIADVDRDGLPDLVTGGSLVLAGHGAAARQLGARLTSTRKAGAFRGAVALHRLAAPSRLCWDFAWTEHPLLRSAAIRRGPRGPLLVRLGSRYREHGCVRVSPRVLGALRSAPRSYWLVASGHWVDDLDRKRAATWRGRLSPGPPSG